MVGDAGGKRPRGRPREIVPPAAGEGVPLSLRRAEYQRTSQAILDAAERLSLQHGVRNLTLAAVAEAAHVDLTTVGYHFRTRNGLLAALHDLQYRDEVADFADRAIQAATPEDRMVAYFDGARRMLADTRATRAYFDLLTFALTDADLRAKLAQQDEWLVTEFIRIVNGNDDAQDPKLRSLAHFIFAAIDGIELHNAVSGTIFPIEYAFELLGQLARSQIGHSIREDPS